MKRTRRGKEPIIKGCLVCGKLMILRPSAKEQEYCSRKCKGIAHSRLKGSPLGTERTISHSSYGKMVQVKVRSGKGGWVAKSTLILTEQMGCLGESDRGNIRYANGDREDCSPENLFLIPQRGSTFACRDCGRIKENTNRKTNVRCRDCYLLHLVNEGGPNRKLTEDQVREIKRRYVRRCPVNGQSALAKEFRVAITNISAIINGLTWKHLK